MRISDWSSDVCSSDLARAGLDQAAREIGNRLASARRGDKQNRRLYLFGGGGLVLGLLLYAVLAGPIARIMPTSWRWPGSMATRILEERNLWDAGQRFMQTDAPENRSEERRVGKDCVSDIK